MDNTMWYKAVLGGLMDGTTSKEVGDAIFNFAGRHIILQFPPMMMILRYRDTMAMLAFKNSRDYAAVEALMVIEQKRNEICPYQPRLHTREEFWKKRKQTVAVNSQH